ncbi:hypothetical protein Tco_1360454 [Tanacetum coccineum]
MFRLQGLGSNTSTGVPYTEDEIMAIVRRGTFPVLVGFCRDKARSFHPRLHARTPPMSCLRSLSHCLSRVNGRWEVPGVLMITREMMRNGGED